MLSLGVWAALLISMFLFMAATLAVVARKLGSPRGRLGVGLAVVVVLGAVGIVLALLQWGLPPRGSGGAVVVGVLLLGLQLAIVFAVLRKAFLLSPGRTAALWGAYLAAGAALVAGLLLVVRPYVTEAFSMPTASMSPTLEPGDRFFVNKRLRPRRWDLVAYWNRPPDGSFEAGVYCKRLIGLPGDRLRVEGGQLYVNDQPQPAPAVLAGRLTAESPGFDKRYRDGQTIQLGPDEYFLVGDNLPRSGDSRLNGPTAGADVVGVVDLRYWPLRKAGVMR